MNECKTMGEASNFSHFATLYKDVRSRSLYNLFLRNAFIDPTSGNKLVCIFHIPYFGGSLLYTKKDGIQKNTSHSAIVQQNVCFIGMQTREQ